MARKLVLPVILAEAAAPRWRAAARRRWGVGTRGWGGVGVRQLQGISATSRLGLSQAPVAAWDFGGFSWAPPGRVATCWCSECHWLTKPPSEHRNSSWPPSAPARTLSMSRPARAMAGTRHGWREPAEVRRGGWLRLNGRGNEPGLQRSSAASAEALAGWGLVLFAEPVRQWRPFAWPLAGFALTPLWRAVGWLTPLGRLSELTAWLSRKWLELCGFSASQQGCLSMRRAAA